MASSAQQADAEIVHSTVGSPLGMRDMTEDKDLEIEVDWTRTEGSPVLWGEFQGTQQTEEEDENEWYHKGLHRCRPDGKNECLCICITSGMAVLHDTPLSSCTCILDLCLLPSLHFHCVSFYIDTNSNAAT